MTSAIVFGGSGLVGGAVLQAALQASRFDSVVSVGRGLLSMQHAKLEQVVIDFDSLADIEVGLTDATVFCCLGTTIKKAGSRAAFRKVDYAYPLEIAQLAQARGASLMSVVTAMGADQDSRIFYNRVKGELERDLQSLGLPSLQLFRPALLLGQRDHFRLGEEVGKIAGRCLPWVGPLKRIQPIEGRDVARFMVAAAGNPRPGVQVFESQDMQPS